MTACMAAFRGMVLRDVVAEKGGMRYLLYISKRDKCSRELREAVKVIAAEYERQNANRG